MDATSAMIEKLLAYVSNVYQTFQREDGEWVATDIRRFLINGNQHALGFSSNDQILKVTESSKSDVTVEFFYTPKYDIDLEQTVLARAKRTVQVVMETPTLRSDGGMTLFFDKGHCVQYPHKSDFVSVLICSKLLLDNCEDE